MLTIKSFKDLSKDARFAAAKGVYDNISADAAFNIPDMVVKTFVRYLKQIVKSDYSFSFLYKKDNNVGTFAVKDFQLQFSYNVTERSIEFGKPGDAVFYGVLPLDCFEELNTLLQYDLKEESLALFLNKTVFELCSLIKNNTTETSYCIAKRFPVFSNFFQYFQRLNKSPKVLHKFSLFETKFLAATEKLIEDAFSNVAFEVADTIMVFEMALESKAAFVEYMEAFYDNGIDTDYIFAELTGKGFLGFTEEGDLIFDETSNYKPEYEMGMDVIKEMCRDCFWVGRNCALADFFPLLDRLQEAVKKYTENHSKTVALYREHMTSLNPEQEPLLEALHKIENLVTFSGSPKDLRLEWQNLYDTIAYSLSNVIQPRIDDNV